MKPKSGKPEPLSFCADSLCAESFSFVDKWSGSDAAKERKARLQTIAADAIATLPEAKGRRSKRRDGRCLSLRVSNIISPSSEEMAYSFVGTTFPIPRSRQSRQPKATNASRVFKKWGRY